MAERVTRVFSVMWCVVRCVEDLGGRKIRRAQVSGRAGGRRAARGWTGE
jgi:hypothetical protein